MKEQMHPYSTRYLCDILKDMRAAHDTRNFSYLLGLIEELQYRAYRMENRISQMDDIETMERKRINLKIEIENLKKEKLELKKEANQQVSEWE